MSRALRSLALFAAEHAARRAGVVSPEREYAMRAALGARGDAAIGRALMEVAADSPTQPEIREVARAAGSVLRGEAEPAALQALARFALLLLRLDLHAQLAQDRRAQGRWWRLVHDAHERLVAEDPAGAWRLLAQGETDALALSLRPVLAGVREALQDAVSPEAEERGPVSPEARGRESRADLVGALLRARSVTLMDVQTGRIFKPSAAGRLDLVDALLRDPFWDDIDQSVEEDSVVASVLAGRPSPGVRVPALGEVSITRIDR